VAGVRETIEAAGAKLLYLPSYLPDLNPALFRVFCVGSVALSVVSAHKNAGTSSSMQAMFERERNPL
jgi:hypothetical protein